MNSTSLMISIFNSSAFSFLDGPILSPANTNDVFLEIEDDAFPPALSIMCFNSFLENFSKTPEMTTALSFRLSLLMDLVLISDTIY